MEEPIIVFNPTIGDVPSKDLILEKFSEELLWTHYGVPIQKGLFCSSVRLDTHPTCVLWRNKKGRLIYKDFGDNWSGDIFAYVGRLYNESYMGALRIIANDFGLIKTEETKNKAKIEYKGEIVEESSTAIIKCEIKPFTSQELAWWESFGVSEKTLKKYNVYSIKNVWLNGNLFHIFNEKQMVFGYYKGVDSENIERWRIYFPVGPIRKRKSFINNWSSNMVQGWAQLPKTGDVVFIQKAMKDAMVMSDLGYASCAPNSENTPLDDAHISNLKARFKRIIVWMDNDEAGINSMAKMAEKYPSLEYYHLPIGQEKDLSDYVQKYGREKAKNLIQEEFFGKLPENW